MCSTESVIAGMSNWSPFKEINSVAFSCFEIDLYLGSSEERSG